MENLPSKLNEHTTVIMVDIERQHTMNIILYILWNFAYAKQFFKDYFVVF